ncbi:hypothetical protein Tco_1467028 [Tanacetum coccineum]
MRKREGEFNNSEDEDVAETILWKKSSQSMVTQCTLVHEDVSFNSVGGSGNNKGGSVLGVLDEMIRVGRAMGLLWRGVENEAAGNSGLGILCIWEESFFKKDYVRFSDSFVAIYGTWIPSKTKLLVVSIYAPQQPSLRRVLWDDDLLILLGRWNGEAILWRDLIKKCDTNVERRDRRQDLMSNLNDLKEMEEDMDLVRQAKIWLCGIVESISHRARTGSLLNSLENFGRLLVRISVKQLSISLYRARSLRKKKKALFFKVDFAKAYDSVRWDFLLDVLEAFGFGSTWCTWIRGDFLILLWLLLLVKWSPSDEFHIHGVLTRLHYYGKQVPFIGVLVGGPKAVLKGYGVNRSNFFKVPACWRKKISGRAWDKVVSSKKKGGLGWRSQMDGQVVTLFGESVRGGVFRQQEFSDYRGLHRCLPPSSFGWEWDEMVLFIRYFRVQLKKMVRPYAIKGCKRKKNKTERYDKEEDEEENVGFVEEEEQQEENVDNDGAHKKLKELAGIPVNLNEQPHDKNSGGVIFILEKASLEVAKVGKVCLRAFRTFANSSNIVMKLFPGLENTILRSLLSSF